MTNEIEQKKEYLTPKMDIIKMDRQTALLEGSCVGEGCVDAIFKK